MTPSSRPSARELCSLRGLVQASLVAFLVVGGGMGVGGPPDVQAQVPAAQCADTLSAAEAAYRNQDFQNAIELASECTDQRIVEDTTAIQAHRLVALASLRQGDLVQARTAIISILGIDPTYTADPVNDPPSYDLFVSQVRENVAPESPDEEPTETPADEEAKPPEEAEAEPPSPTPSRARPSFFIKPLSVGLSDYTGDMPAQSVSHPLDFQEISRGSGIPITFHGELGYQFSARWALVLGFQTGNYPIVGYNTGNNDISDSWRHTPQLLVRYAFGTLGESVAFYLDGGGNVTFGGGGIAKTGYGPSVGGGVDIPLSNALSLYVESRFNFTFPDDAIDGSAPIRSAGGFGSSFDQVNQLLGVGLRVRFGGS